MVQNGSFATSMLGEEDLMDEHAAVAVMSAWANFTRALNACLHSQKFDSSSASKLSGTAQQLCAAVPEEVVLEMRRRASDKFLRGAVEQLRAALPSLVVTPDAMQEQGAAEHASANVTAVALLDLNPSQLEKNLHMGLERVHGIVYAHKQYAKALDQTFRTLLPKMREDGISLESK